MARILSYGAELRSSLEFAWGNAVSSTSYTTPGRGGYTGTYFATVSGGVTAGWNIPGTTEFFFRCAIRLSAQSNTTPVARIQFFDATGGGGNSVLLLASPDSGANLGQLKITAGASTVLGTITGSVLSTSAWTLVEVYFKLDASVGVCTVKYNGTQVFTFSGNTNPNSRTNVQSLGFISAGGTAESFDDVAINDTTTGTNNSWAGDGYVFALTPNGNGDVSQWTNNSGNSTNNYSHVNTLPPQITTYVQDGTVGDQDFYTLTDFPTIITPFTVTLVWIQIYAERVSPGTAQNMDFGLETSSTKYLTGSPVALTASPVLYSSTPWLLNPNSGVAWTTADINALAAGVKVTT